MTKTDRANDSRPLLRKRRLLPVILVGMFLVGLLFRFLALDFGRDGVPGHGTRWQPGSFAPFLENDEKIYMALVDQLENGRGYTLQGNPILNERWVDQQQYNRPLFFHPPGGIAFFWLTHWIAGEAGYALAQVLSFAVFYWSMILLGWLALRHTAGPAMPSLAILTAFAPIMAQVMGRFWLDGPLLAFSTAAIAVYLLGIQRSNTALACVAGLLMGYASLIKLPAFLVIPGGVLLAWSLTSPERRIVLARNTFLLLAIAFLVQVPWEYWQWRVVGSPFPGWAGKPAASLVKMNPYVYYVTVVRSPWFYIKFLPQVIWTLCPSLILLALQCWNRELRRRGTALVLWIVIVVGTHIILGAVGYSKLLRYVILVTPATLLLCTLVVDGLARTIQEGNWLFGGRVVTVASLVLLILGIGLEVAQGIVTSLIDNRTIDLIRPLPVFSALAGWFRAFK